MTWTIINNDKEYNRALERMEAIFDTHENLENNDEFDLLTLLINKYEEEKYPIEPADPIQVLKMKNF